MGMFSEPAMLDPYQHWQQSSSHLIVVADEIEVDVR
jgi:hypothetical protein